MFFTFLHVLNWIYYPIDSPIKYNRIYESKPVKLEAVYILTETHLNWRYTRPSKFKFLNAYINCFYLPGLAYLFILESFMKVTSKRFLKRYWHLSFFCYQLYSPFYLN